MSRQNAHPRRHARQSDRRQPRTLHAVDIDNLLGGPDGTDRSQIERVLTSYRRAAEYQPGDHVIVATGCNGLHVLEAELAWARVAHRRRRGRDGADNLLIEELEWVQETKRFDRVVIGSGDHIFASAAQSLIAAGIAVRVVATPRGLSRHLRIAVGPNVRLIRPIAIG